MLILFSCGFLIGVLLNAFYRLSKIDKYQYKYHVEVLEHWHFGLLSLILAQALNTDFFCGLCIPLFADEVWGQEHIFSFGSEHQAQSFLLGLMLLLVLYVLCVG